MTTVATGGSALQVIATPVHPPSPRAPALWRLNGAVRAVLLLTAQGFWWWLAPDTLAGLRWPVLVATLVLAALDLLVAPPVRHRIHRWSVDGGVLVARSGWLLSDTRVVPAGRMQTVTVTSGPTDRLLGLASVTVTTASSAGPVRVMAVARSTAELLAAELSALAGLDSGQDGTRDGDQDRDPDSG